MPIQIPNDLPAAEVLQKENIFVMKQTRAETQHIRPLEIVLLNLMPTKIVTETQLSRMLGNTPLQVHLELMMLSTHKAKNTPEEAVKKNQRLLITWITDNPGIYKSIKKYISPEDFTEDLYRQVAEKLFEDIEKDAYNPAAIIGMFTEDEQQRQVAELFSTTLSGLETQAEREKAFHDIIVAVKTNSYQHYSQQLGSDIGALQRVIEGKKSLEELQKTHILLNER